MMRLSEAIRLGSMMGPKIIGERHDGKGGTCALGAIEAAHGATGWKCPKRIPAQDLYPELREEVISPHTGDQGCLERVIASLSDGRYWHFDTPKYFTPWTREAIADWVATIERKPQPNSHAVLEQDTVSVPA